MTATGGMAADSTASRPDRTVTVFLSGYVVLWILEGAFRKWVPGTELVFYVLRDVLAIVALAWLASGRSRTSRRLPWWVVACFALLCCWLAAQYLVPDSAPPVILLFGLRSYAAPFLFAVLCYKYGDLHSLDRFTTVIALAVPLELVLAVVQVLSPSTAQINIQVGGSPNQFVNAGDIVRTTGTFSAPLGFTVFLLVALVVALWWTDRPGKRGTGWILVSCVLVTVALSGARGAVLNSAILIAAFLVYSLARGTRSSVGQALLLCSLLAVAVIAVQVVLPDVIQSFLDRFSDASDSEDSSGRLADAFGGYLFQSPALLGDGFGVRSNAGIALGSSARWIENDNLRWVAELGVLGYLLGLLRSVAAIALSVQAIVRLRRDPAGVLLVRTGLIVLLTLGSVNETPMNEGAFAILLGSLVLGTAGRRVRATVAPGAREAVAPLPAEAPPGRSGGYG